MGSSAPIGRAVDALLPAPRLPPATTFGVLEPVRGSSAPSQRSLARGPERNGKLIRFAPHCIDALDTAARKAAGGIAPYVVCNDMKKNPGWRRLRGSDFP